MEDMEDTCFAQDWLRVFDVTGKYDFSQPHPLPFLLPLLDPRLGLETVVSQLCRSCFVSWGSLWSLPLLARP